jgi:hypothetical protein
MPFGDRRRRALDQAQGQAEAGAKQLLTPSHFAVVDLVVVSGQMKQAVENQHLQFTGERVALLGGLSPGRVHADGQVACDFLGSDAFGGKRKHISRFVFAAELAIELADGGVCGKQDGDLAFEADGGLRLG